MADPSPRGLLAVAFGPSTMSEALAGLPRIRAEADCVELRLDLFEEPFDLPALLEACGGLPVVATLRPPDEGGKSPLAATERLEVLLAAARLGAQYVDLEWNAGSPQAIEAVRGEGAQVVLSKHDFASMPADLAERWPAQLAELGADVVKIVGTARDVRDCLQVFRAFERADRPTIAIAMGEAGVSARKPAPRAPQCLPAVSARGAGTRPAPG